VAGKRYYFQLRAEVSPWLSGAADALESRRDIAFNGAKVTTVDHAAWHHKFSGPTRVESVVPGIGELRTGPTTRVDSSEMMVRQVRIDPGPMELRKMTLYQALYHGRMSPVFHQEESPSQMRLSEQLMLFREKGNPVVEEVQVEGRGLVRVKYEKGPSRWEYHFDPARGMALTGSMIQLGGGEPGRSTDGLQLWRRGQVLEWKEIRPGIFYPLRSVYTEFENRPEARVFKRYTADSEDAAAVDTLTDEDFQAQIPPGYIVHEGTDVYRMGQTPGERIELPRMVNGQLVTPGATTQAAAPAVPPSPPPFWVRVLETPKLWFGVVLMIVVVAAVGLAWLAGRVSGKSAA
jgi:hypothetical protein